MKETISTSDYLQFYAVNEDYSGSRNVDDEHKEIVEFRNESSIRIWYNDLNVSYAPHWLGAIELIMPVENY